MRNREKFSKYKYLINIIVRFYSIFSKKKLNKKLEKHRYKRGRLGLVIRYAILKNVAKSCGDNVYVGTGAYILNPEKISIGNNVSIHPMCYLEGYGGISIGNDVSIAHGATIMSASHEYSDLSIPIKDQPVLGKEVVISDNVWIGAKATILFGKHIAKGSVIGANSVVTHDVGENQIVGGVPARVIKERK